jgi:hypothetical protein
MVLFNPDDAIDPNPSTPIIDDMGDPAKASTHSLSASAFWSYTHARRASAHL